MLCDTVLQLPFDWLSFDSIQKQQQHQNSICLHVHGISINEFKWIVLLWVNHLRLMVADKTWTMSINLIKSRNSIRNWQKWFHFFFVVGLPRSNFFHWISIADNIRVFAPSINPINFDDLPQSVFNWIIFYFSPFVHNWSFISVCLSHS